MLNNRTPGRPAALPRLPGAEFIRFRQHEQLCATCDAVTATGYIWPAAATGYWVLMPQCAACAAETVRRNTAYTAAVPAAYPAPSGFADQLLRAAKAEYESRITRKAETCVN